MSYSRWGSGSVWYTFWSSMGDDDETKDSQVFEICALISFTYKELKEDIEKCLTMVKSEAAFQYNDESQPKEAEMNELMGYMLQFIKDVESDASLK